MDNEILREETEEIAPDNITEEFSALEELSDLTELSDSAESVELPESENPDNEAAENQEAVPEKNFIKRFFKAEKGKSTGETVMYYARETCVWAFMLVAAFFIAVLFNMYVIRLSNVVGNSMNYTLHDGDKVKLSQMPYIFGEPERGDIIIFDSTKEDKNFFGDFAEACRFNMITQLFMSEKEKEDITGKYYIKRIIGVEGDIISIKDNQVYLNGELLEEPYLSDEITANYSLHEGMYWTVGEGEVFVMGDNRGFLKSKDSREIGCIPIGCILGKVFAS